MGRRQRRAYFFFSPAAAASTSALSVRSQVKDFSELNQ
jgi:hypothetical protein